MRRSKLSFLDVCGSLETTVTSVVKPPAVHPVHRGGFHSCPKSDLLHDFTTTDSPVSAGEFAAPEGSDPIEQFNQKIRMDSLTLLLSSPWPRSVLASKNILLRGEIWF